MQPSPELFFDTLNAYQRTAALKAALQFDLFSKISSEGGTSVDLARACNASERGMRILCDCLVVIGFLTKSAARYGLTADSALFLDRKSPAYLGSAVEFLGSEML